MAQAAHRLGPKDKKNVGGAFRIIHNRICPSVAVCYAAFPRPGLAVSRHCPVSAEGRRTADGHLESHTTAPSIRH